MIVAPHTSGWDFIFGAAAKQLLGFDAKYLAKKELFKWPLKNMFVRLGGVPVDRGKHNGMVEAMIDYLNSNEKAIVVFPPEGTRKRTSRWKKGFYHVALGANVPIIMAYIDFKQKKAGMGPYFTPSGDIKADFKIIADFYKDITACHPEKFALPE
ncbi:MAG: 1-acyl-sn-glycerol-3-phosphate acyltransferase [Chitinophagales bacterium]